MRVRPTARLAHQLRRWNTEVGMGSSTFSSRVHGVFTTDDGERRSSALCTAPMRPAVPTAIRAALAALGLSLTLSTLSCAAGTTMDAGPSAPTVEYVTEQEILTPLPLRVRLPASYGAEHVVVLYRTWGSRGWSQLELARSGQTWTGEVSCRQVSTVTGDTRYFFVALDGEGELVGGSGSPDWPHVATIVGSLPSGARSLPRGSVPLRCHDPADCPPDFPGCPAYAFSRRACRTARDCNDGDRCAWDGYCGPPYATELTKSVDGTEEEQLAAAVRAIRDRYRKSSSTSPRSTRGPSHASAVHR